MRKGGEKSSGIEEERTAEVGEEKEEEYSGIEVDDGLDGRKVEEERIGGEVGEDEGKR